MRAYQLVEWRQPPVLAAYQKFCTLPVRVRADEVAARVALLLWNTAC